MLCCLSCDWLDRRLTWMVLLLMVCQLLLWLMSHLWMMRWVYDQGIISWMVPTNTPGLCRVWCPSTFVHIVWFACILVLFVCTFSACPSTESFLKHSLKFRHWFAQRIPEGICVPKLTVVCRGECNRRSSVNDRPKIGYVRQRWLNAGHCDRAKFFPEWCCVRSF